MNPTPVSSWGTEPRSSGWGLALIGAGLVAFYIMLPLDRGFPRIPVLGRPLNPAVVASVGALVVTIFHSRGGALSLFRHRYCVILSLYVVVLIGASLRAAAPLAALQLTAAFYSTFVVNYVVLRYIADRAGASRLVALVAWVGVAAAGVGVLQGLFGIRFAIYETWYTRYFQAQAPDQAAGGARGFGTLSHPILYGTAMALLVPYVLSIRSVVLRGVLLSVILVAAALTGSRTVLLAMLVFVVGAIVVYRWRTLWVVPWVFVVAAFGVQVLGGWGAAVSDPRVRYLAGRVGIGDDASSQYAAGNIALRKEALVHGFREVSTQWGPVTWLVGKGQFASAELGQEVSATFNTVDNAFFGILYEKGLVGLAFFLWAFLAHLRVTRGTARSTLHWYAPVALLATGFSFSFDAYSTFNILAVCSMAIASVLATGSRLRGVQAVSGARTITSMADKLPPRP